MHFQSVSINILSIMIKNVELIWESEVFCSFLELKCIDLFVLPEKPTCIRYFFLVFDILAPFRPFKAHFDSLSIKPFIYIIHTDALKLYKIIQIKA